MKYFVFFFFKQKTAYEMRISDWSSDVCSSDLSSRAEDGEALSDFVFRQFAKRLAQATDRKAAGPHQRLDGDRVDRRIVEMEQRQQRQIGRASCRARVCQYV